MPFDQLPKEQQAKDYIFRAVVIALAGLEVDQKDPHPAADRDGEIVANKTLRRDIDVELQRLKSLPSSRERELSITKLQEAVMWLGMDLKRLNEANPYPSSKDPSNTKIEPTADGLKL